MIMFSTQSTLAFVVCLATFARSAPAVTNATLLQSAQEAQALNAQFLTLTTSSPCGNLTAACVANAISNCENDAWVAPKGACSQGTFCFATPNLRGAGTILQCTSNKTASSIIEASGASGGITGLDTTDTSANSSTSSSTSATPTASDASDSQVTVTVTVTQPIITGTVTQTSTQTVSPDQASSIISSLIAAGGQAAPTVAAGSDDSDSADCTKTHKMSKKHGSATAMATSESTTDASATATTASASATSDAAATEAASAGAIATSSGSGY
ncbi:hypothetical protein HYPSUDRAFT_84223 [Hypholoma sublateritium FD-334 SS-4]|uniref:Carbohydrate-binding module family 19 domain-containing protein n=1 Tax=Hypholoma sublateritium (strain FD-334 SS-4) TaxID=945553 RepID=A0A0D2LGP2_HYPSF|nr:hypothetical protein HYPSUDRAFT_84223 [Hypholoma sublateritium FD-334 SS-4]